MRLFDDEDEEQEEQSNKQKGLKGLMPDEPDDGNESSGSQRKYVQPNQSDFEDFLADVEDELDINWSIASDANSNEIVYETPDVLPEHTGRVLRIFSTIEERTGKARSKGSDAIRTVIWDRNMNVPIGGRTKTLRIKTWRKNLRGKIVSLIQETSEYVTICDECGEFMVVREGKYGKFLGCSAYPDCDNTKQIED